MKETYTTEKVAKRLRLITKLALLMAIAGAILLVTSIYSADRISGGFIGKSLDSAFMIVIGIGTFIVFRKTTKNIDGNYIEFYENGVSCKINGNDYQFSQENKPKSIDIKLKSVDITTSDNATLIVVLDYYSKDFATRKKIKERFTQYK